MDQRIQKTYTDLQASMRTLLGNLSWEQITVQTLCDTANISRSTFYVHFSNKDDLLDSLLRQFEKGMLSTNNARSIRTTGTLKFLPVLLNHVRENRQLFVKNNTEIAGYPVAIRFKNLISRLVEAELKEAFGSDFINLASVNYVSGGIYSALVHWSAHSEDTMHLKLLNNLDEITRSVLPNFEQPSE